MSKNRTRQVVHDLMTDEELLAEWRENPEAVRERYGLSEAEFEALTSGDADRIKAVLDDREAGEVTLIR